VYKKRGAFFIIPFLLALFGCSRRVGLGTYRQDIKGEGGSYTVSIGGVEYDDYAGTTVGVRVAGIGGAAYFRGNIPVGAYILNADEEYRYDDYDVNGDTINFRFYDTDEVPERIMVYPGDDPDEVVKHKAFDGRTKEAVRFFVPPNLAVDIGALIRQRKLRAEIIGRSMERTAVMVTNIYFAVVPVKIEIGTWFDSFSDDTQNMAVTRDVSFLVEPQKSYTITIPSACMNQHKSAPDRSDSFSVKSLKRSENKELIPLIKQLRQNDIPDELIQVAVWILTDDDVDDIVANLDDYFGTNALQNTILNLVDRFFGTKLNNQHNSAEAETTKKIIRRVHKPKGRIPFIR
jgi:hypothetical protein